MCLYISVIAEKEICWHLFKIVLLEFKNNYFVECCLKLKPHCKENGVTLCISIIWSCISLMKFFCECTSADYLSFHSRTLFIMKRNVLPSFFDSYWWGSFYKERLSFLSYSCSVAYFLNVVSVYYADLWCCRKGSWNTVGILLQPAGNETK